MLTSDIENGLEGHGSGVRNPAVGENAVGHAMRDDAPLLIEIKAERKGPTLSYVLRRWGGYPQRALATMLQDTDRSTWNALKNVDDGL
jgi:hypothetical protein